MNWTSDPPKEWRATWALGWELHVCRNTTDTAWEWTVSVNSNGILASMGGSAETSERCKTSAEEAADCLDLALREFAHHMTKLFPPSPPGLPPY